MPNETGHARQHPTVPESMTRAGWNFQREHERLFGFVAYLAHLATSTDEKARIAARALYESDEPEKYRETLGRIEKHGATSDLRNLHRTLVLEMMLCRAADNFLAYVSEFLAIVFRTRPETLRSSETVRIETVLKHATMTELIQELAEHRVNQLSYQGMRDLAAYLDERLGFELFSDPRDLERAVRIIESRNLIVHNRGFVNRLFLTRVPTTQARVGEPLDLNTDQIFDDLEFIAHAVYGIDLRGVQKFGLVSGLKSGSTDG